MQKLCYTIRLAEVDMVMSSRQRSWTMYSTFHKHEADSDAKDAGDLRYKAISLLSRT